MMWGMHSPWLWGILLFRWLFLAVLVGFAVWWFTGRRPRDESDALAILKRRLAAGEIDEAEYARLRELLK